MQGFGGNGEESAKMRKKRCTNISTLKKIKTLKKLLKVAWQFPMTPRYQDQSRRLGFQLLLPFLQQPGTCGSLLTPGVKVKRERRGGADMHVYLPATALTCCFGSFFIFPDITIHHILLKEFPQSLLYLSSFQDVTPLPYWIRVRGEDNLCKMIDWHAHIVVTFLDKI